MPDARIAVIGDFQPGNETHEALAPAVAHADEAAGRPGATSVDWIGTDDVHAVPRSVLDGYDGFWIAPGSPYRSMDGALSVIRLARESDRPLLGTCAGFQHIVIEAARNMLGIPDAAHAENNPDAPDLFVTPLSCSLVGQTMTVTVVPGTRAASLYSSATATERYYCNFGLDPDRVGELETAGMVVSATDQDGEPRVIELPHLRFFVGTLFVPQTSSSAGSPHPVVSGFVASLHAARAAAAPPAVQPT